jgi:hypothetical protein
MHPADGRLTGAGVIRRTGSCLAGAALALIALAPWPVLALLSAPSVDDFCLFALVRDPGWAAAQRQMYQDHSGRFVATALITGLGWLTDRLGAGLPGPFTLLPLLAIAAILWLCWRTLARLFPERPAAQRAIATALSGALLLATLPGAGELLFWTSGMASYLPLLLLLWYLMLRVADTLKGRPPGGGETALLTALAFLVAGTHELGGPLILLLLAAWAEAGRRRGWARSGFAWLAAIGAGALIAYAIVLAAPGNGTRLSDYPGSGNPLQALPMGLADTVIFLAVRVAAVPPLLGGLSLAWLLAARRPSPPAAAAGWLLPATWLAVLLVAAIVSRYAMNHALPHRGLDLLYAIGVPPLAFAAMWHGRVRGAGCPFPPPWRPARTCPTGSHAPWRALTRSWTRSRSMSAKASSMPHLTRPRACSLRALVMRCRPTPFARRPTSRPTRSCKKEPEVVDAPSCHLLDPEPSQNLSTSSGKQ